MQKEISWGSGPLKITFQILAHFNGISKVHIFAKSRSSLAKVLKEFRRARHSIGTSSTANLAGLYKPGSLRWLACHSGKIIDGEKIVKFKNPNTRKIIYYLEH